jgi:uncharacterized protein YjbI with pentapeptide repeats
LGTYCFAYESGLIDNATCIISLSGADLNAASLREVDLRDANLSDVKNITIEELEEQTASLEGATMPDGSIHP